MQTNRQALVTALWIVAAAASSFPGHAWAGPAKRSPPATIGGITGISFFFKLDPRLSGATYGGERWVSPPTYKTTLAPVAVRAAGVDARGRVAKIAPKWISADPELVTVSPTEGSEVTISVTHAGQSSVEVKSGSISRKLSITASVLPSKALLVEIAPQPIAAGAKP